MTISESLLPEFDQEMANTRKMLERVPDDKFGWKPHEKSMPMGHLAAHIAEFPSWAKSTMEVEKLVIPADFKPFNPSNNRELLARFDENLTGAREAIARGSDADMQKIWSMEFNGKQIMSMPRAAVLRGVVMNHLIHHRGQLSVYLRLNDIPVPGMYGASADEPQWWN